MKTSLLKQYKKEIIFFYSFSAVALLIATFWDLQIDLVLNNNRSFVSNWFDRTGEMPAAILSVIAFAFITKCAGRIWLKIISAIATLGAGAYFGIWFGERLFADTVYQTFFNVIYGVGTAVFILLVVQFLVIHEKYRKPLIAVSIIALCAMGAETLVTTGMKALWGRIRFRNLDGEFTNFTPWYIINGNTGQHSFPSGHTASAGMSYMLMLLPFVSARCREYKSVLFIGGFLYTSMVAFTRLVMGAHYLSDVVIGSAISFSLTIAAIAVYERFFQKKIGLTNEI
ncbi:MAG: phosphatase PAP2 family protein [Clostridia bacterium]|nr:phosphatase PAP2 family protein [Clostridia bacterium]